MSIKIILVGFVILAVVVAVVLIRFNSSSHTGKYKQRKLMTDNEREFFGRLVKALPGHYVFAQVGMGAILEPSSRDKKRSHSDRLRIAQQRLDYVVCDTNCEIVAVVELDDKTHSRAKDEIRDSRLLQGGIRTIRFQSRNKPSIDVIRAAVFPNTTSATVSGVTGHVSAHSANVAPSKVSIGAAQP